MNIGYGKITADKVAGDEYNVVSYHVYGAALIYLLCIVGCLAIFFKKSLNDLADMKRKHLQRQGTTPFQAISDL